MSVKADWGTTTLDAGPASFDPLAMASFGAMTSTLKPASAEKPLDLSTPTPELRSWLRELVRREGNLFDRGVTCPLRDADGGSCAACPVSCADREEGTLEEMRQASLCRIGAEQERVSMLLIAQRRGV